MLTVAKRNVIILIGGLICSEKGYFMKETNKHFSYKPLWKLLIDRDISKQKLREMTGLSPASISKLTKGQNVNTDVLLAICDALSCGIGEIVEIALLFTAK